MQDDSNPLLKIRNLAVTFPDAAGGPRVKAVQNVSLTVFPRQTLAVVGESGSGKSVTAMSALRLIPTPPGRYDGGEILWRDHDETEFVDMLKVDKRKLRSVRGNQIAMIFQEPMTSLNPVFTIGFQILEAIRLHQDVDRSGAVEIAVEALNAVGIADPESRLSEYPHQYSGGMRQRVMIAMALACQPSLLLADEPTTALDVTIQAQILELLRTLQVSKNMSVLLITHDLGVVAENADVVAVMYNGRIVEYASVYDIFDRPLHPYTCGLFASMPVLGRTKKRLPTVKDGAVPPDDFPAGFRVPAGLDLAPAGEPDPELIEVEPNRWVLCWPEQGNTSYKTDPPSLTFRRHEVEGADGASMNPSDPSNPLE